MTNDVFKYLAGLAIPQRLLNPSRPAWIIPAIIESDKRKQAKAIKKLVEDGVIEKRDDQTPPYDYCVTDKVYDLILAESVDIVEQWRSRFDVDEEHTHLPFVRVRERLTLGQIKNLIENRDEYDWYVASIGTIVGSTFASERIAIGPMSYREALSKYDSIRKDNIFRRKEMELVVSSPELRSVASDTVRKAKIDQLFRVNLAAGLNSLGIITEDEGKRILGDSMPFGLGSGSAVLLGTDPSQWSDAAARERDRLVKKLADVQSAINLLDKIEQGIAHNGGWDVVKEKYRANLEAAYDKKVGKADLERGNDQP